MNFNKRHNQGLIQALVAIVTSVIILSLFGVDLRERVESPLVQKNLYFVWGTATSSAAWLWDSATKYIHK